MKRKYYCQPNMASVFTVYLTLVGKTFRFLQKCQQSWFSILQTGGYWEEIRSAWTNNKTLDGL